MSRATDRLEIIAAFFETIERPVSAVRVRQAIVEINSLQAIVDKLPKTADGVPVVPGMVLYSSQFICGHFRHPEIVVSLHPYADEHVSGWMSGALGEEELYSTREAAEAAHKGKE